MDRKQAIELVRKLAEVTVERGSAPAEEDKATRRAKHLIAEFGLTYQEVAGEPMPPVQDWSARVARPHFPMSTGASGYRRFAYGVTFTINFD